MQPTKKLYDAMTNEPAKPSLGHTASKMDLAAKMFDYAPKAKKMAKGGCACRGDGIAQRGKTKGRIV